MSTRWLVLVALAVLPVAACDGGQEADAEAVPEMAEAAEAAASPSQQMQALPDTTAEAVWSYLHAAGYQDWQLWPGKGELYEGTEPHGMLLTTYLNETAHAGLTTGSSGPLPNGSIVVKENYRPDSTLAAITVMYSSEGYDADFNDYFWAKYGADGSVQAAGRVESCQSCHSAGERGFLRTPYEGGM